MRVLIDTCIFIHLAIDRDQLSDDVLAILTDYDNTICISAETPRELIIQYNNGKVVSKFWKSARQMIDAIKDEFFINILPLKEEHMKTYSELELDKAQDHKDPSDHVINEYQKKSISLKKIFANLEKLNKTPTETLDNIKISLSLNYGLDLDYNYIVPSNCDGIGLYRTEITFMASDKMPDVESQERQYKRLFDAMGNKRIIFRSLDVGSDKFLPYWGEIKEDNPAIGWRSIRITLDRRAILRQQIRAMLRAAADRDLYVMFPMISTLQEFLDAKETLLLEYEHEKQKGNPTAKFRRCCSNWMNCCRK